MTSPQVATNTQGFGVRRLSPSFGAEITEIDLSQQIDDETLSRIETLFNAEGLLVFRNQGLVPKQHIDFSRRFGELEIHFLKQFLNPEHPELLVVSNIIENDKPIGQADAGQAWHTDLSYAAEPSRGSLIYAIEIPEKDGEPLGDTLFANTACAYDALPEEMKRKLNGLNASHAFDARYRHAKKSRARQVDLTDAQRAGAKEIAHPVVRRHPVTGRKCIYVNKVFTIRILGLPEEESSDLLEGLFAHCVRPEFVYRHKWRVGDLVMWDNCSTLHCAVGDYAWPQRRWLQKTTLKGTVPF